jgi:DNA invertase Pin-like site-specific DNA recombinase
MALPIAPAQVVAASYERVSTRDQARRGFSLITQRQTVDEYCREAGLELPDELHFRDGVDQDASGADWNLPDLTRMLGLAKQREFQILVVPDYDRFARNMAKALVLESQLATYGVEVRYMNLPFDNSAEGQ